jgi:DNA-binding PadR family transcriptional regulator
MSRIDLKPFSYVVLALVGEGGAGPYDIAAIMRRSPLYWEAAPSQWYGEPKRLRELGYLHAHKEPGRTRERTHYRLTEQGRDALREWLAEPARFMRVQNEAAARLLAGDLVGDEVILRSLWALRAQIAELSASLAASEEVARGISPRARYLALSHRLPRKLLDAHLEWLDEVEGELGSGRPGKEPSAAAGP